MVRVVGIDHIVILKLEGMKYGEKHEQAARKRRARNSK
jgi:hypothetical protein